MKITIITIFPEFFDSFQTTSIIKRAIENQRVTFETVDFRSFSTDKHHHVDDTPYGGGQGMVLSCQPIIDALRSVRTPQSHVIMMTPQGGSFCQKKAVELSGYEHLIILCGHYEGVDQRVIDYWNMEEISIGDYILTGGELPAMVLIDAVARFLPEVLGNAMSADDESIYSGLLECDQYTKPRSYQNMEVPEVLTGGNHKMIHLWQFENALNLTRERRPDLWEAYLDSEKNLTKDEKKILEKVVSKPL